ncbi:AAA family ATPase [Qipengyuania sp. 1NDH17]|uniref:AAA family ATPase n=1 Tax=Qipengyuania polymorpha TaxID=2867234 RepID=A0ABS7J1V4_9SPHN|nr:AAA family ATPase [Qipengyuania polymorpha]
MAGPQRFVLTGGPGAGKTTLLAELARRGFRTVPEAARAVLRGEGGPGLRANDPDGFAAAILKREICRHAAAAGWEGPMFYDRGLGDLAAMPVSSRSLKAEIERQLQACRYEPVVFRAPAWEEIYCRDAERTQSWDEAVASDLAVTSAWRGAGYTIVDLPSLDPAGRAEFVLALI